MSMRRPPAAEVVEPRPDGADPDPDPAQPDAATEAPAFAADPRRWKVLLFMLLGQFMVTSGNGSLTIVLPAIRDDFNTSDAQVQWVLVLYQLAFAMTLVTGGRLGDMLGRKRVFVAGLAAFGAASVLAAVAPNAPVLIFARLLMGVAGGLASPQVLAMIQATFPTDERRRAFAVFAAVTGSAFMIGQLLTGVLLDVDLFGLGWRATFLFGAVVGVVAIAGVVAMLPNPPAGRRTAIDPLGVALLSLGSILVLYPIIQGRAAGWPPVFFLAMASAVPVLVALLRHERAVEARGGSPLVDLDLFRIRTFRVGLVTAMMLSSLTLPGFALATYAVQSGLGYSALETALLTAPTSVLFIAANLMAARYSERLGRRIFAIGGVTNGVAALLTIALFNMGGRPNVWQILVPMVAIGIGHGTCTSALTHFALGGVASHQAGSAAGVLQTVQQATGALSLSLLSTIYFGVLGSRTAITDQVAALSAVMVVVALLAVGLGLMTLAMPPRRPRATPEVVTP